MRIMQKIPMESLDKQFSSLIKKAIDGEEVIFLEDEKPVARLEPLLNEKKPVALARGAAKNVVLYMADDFNDTPEDFEDYM